MLPIVKYAHIIGKNTAKFTIGDMLKFVEWLGKNRKKLYPKKKKIYRRKKK